MGDKWLSSIHVDIKLSYWSLTSQMSHWTFYKNSEYSAMWTVCKCTTTYFLWLCKWVFSTEKIGNYWKRWNCRIFYLKSTSILQIIRRNDSLQLNDLYSEGQSWEISKQPLVLKRKSNNLHNAVYFHSTPLMWH